MANLDDYVNYFSNYRFGNEVLANLGNSRATISGSDSLENIKKYVTSEPEPLNLRARFAFLPVIQNQNAEGGTMPSNDNAEGGGALIGNDTQPRIYAIYKLWSLYILAIVLVAIGLYFFVKSTDTGQIAINVAKKAASGGAI